MISPTASTNALAGRSLLWAPWRGGAAIYLAVLAGAMAIGLWPASIYPSRDAFPPAGLPVLQMLAVGQVGFVLLIYPLILLARRRREGMWTHLPVWCAATMVVESAWMLAAAAPFYVAGAYLADATTVDAVRTAGYVALVFPVAWSAQGWLAGGPASRSCGLVAMLIAAIGLPAAYYISREFFGVAPQGGGDWLLRLGPGTFAWATARSRQGSWFPRPLWAALVWPTIATAAAVGRALLPSGKAE